MGCKQHDTSVAYVCASNCTLSRLTSKPHDQFLKNFTSRQEVALLDLIDDIRARTAIAWIRGHNEVDSGKACPGFWVPDWLKAEGVKV